VLQVVEIATMLEEQTHLVLARVGLVLLVLGVVDISIMVYSIVNGISYSSSFNIFAVCLGVLLIRGNLWAASVVRFFCALFAASTVTLVAILPFLQPINLTLAEIRQGSLFDLLVPLAFLASSLWAAVELNGEPIHAAFHAAGKSVAPLAFPVSLGIGLVAAAGAVVAFT
jgi:hypothetical protein